MYVSLPQLAELPGALELSQVASDAHGQVVEAALMDCTLRGTDRSAYSSEAIAAADVAKARILDVIDETGAVINGYIGKRYTLPLSFVPSILRAWARAIVRYRLHKDRVGDDRSDPIVRDYNDAIKFLQQVASGSFSLGLEDPSVAAHTDSEMQFHPGHKVFGREYLP